MRLEDNGLSMKKIPRQVIILGWVSLFTDIASEMLYPVTPLFLTTVLGTSMAVIGIIEGIAEFTAGLLKGYFGRLSDKSGKRSKFVSIGYSLSAIAKPLPGIFPYLSTVVLSRVTDRIGKGIRTAPRDALLAAYANGNTGVIFGFHRAMDTLGAAIGPIIALIWLHFYPKDFIPIFLFAFIPSIIAVGLTIFVKNKTIVSHEKTKEPYFLFWKNAPSGFKTIIFLITIFSLVNSSDVFLILKSQEVSHLNSLAIIGYIFYNLIYAAASYPIGRLSDKLGKKKVFIVGLFIFSAVYLGFAIFPNQGIMWGLFAFYGIYAASTEGVAKAWVSDLIPDKNRGTAIGLLTMLSSFAMMLGSVIAGYLWDTFGSSVPFLLSSGVSFIVGIVFIFMHKHTLTTS